VPTPGRLAALLLNWFAANARDLPWRHTRDPYAIWVSEVMLQQTQVQTVVPYWTRWMQALPSLQSLAAAPVEQVLKLWEGLGYYLRARNLQRAARLVEHDHHGAFPDRQEAMLALPGIGPYTAGAIGSLAYNHPTPVLDGNVIRVLTRMFGIRQRVDRARTRRRLQALATALVDAAAARHRPRQRSRCANWRVRRVQERPCGALNEALMELGAVVCTPRQPRCKICPLTRHCVARQAGIAEQLPSKPGRPASLLRRVFVFVWQRNARWLVRQRPAGVVNAGLWELPNVEAATHLLPLEAARSLFGGSVRATTSLLNLRHTITRHRITLEVHEVVTSGDIPTGAAGQWRTARQLERLAFPAAHRKILRHVLGRTPRLAESPGSGTVRG
jgi:A/G-specific adenine glycosylase